MVVLLTLRAECSLYALVTSDRQLAQAAPGPLFRRDAATHCDGVADAGETTLVLQAFQ